MEADEYLAEYIIRDRLAEARTRAEFAALRCQSRPGPDVKGIGRLIDLGRALVNRRRLKLSASSATGLSAPGRAQ